MGTQAALVVCWGGEGSGSLGLPERIGAGGVRSKGRLRPGARVASSDIPAQSGPEARLTHPLAEGGEGVQALLILGRVPKLCVIAAATLCGGEGERPVTGAQQ